MKKIFSVILAVVIVASMAAIGASAERIVGGNTGNITDGVETFDPTTGVSQDIYVQVTEIAHRYAVDITYSLDDLTLGGTITWDVNSLEYVIVANGSLVDATRTIEVSNRSDLPVKAFATVTDADAADYISVTADYNSDATALTIAKADITTKTATAENITLTIGSTDWTEAAIYYAGKHTSDLGAGRYKIASVTVTVSKAD